MRFRPADIVPMIEYMFSDELLDLLSKVIKSWQVIAVTVALVLYISLVNYAARAYHKPAFVSKTKPKKKKKPKTDGKNNPEESPDIIHEQE